MRSLAHTLAHSDIACMMLCGQRRHARGQHQQPDVLERKQQQHPTATAALGSHGQLCPLHLRRPGPQCMHDGESPSCHRSRAFHRGRRYHRHDKRRLARRRRGLRKRPNAGTVQLADNLCRQSDVRRISRVSNRGYGRHGRHTAVLCHLHRPRAAFVDSRQCCPAGRRDSRSIRPGVVLRKRNIRWHGIWPHRFPVLVRGW